MHARPWLDFQHHKQVMSYNVIPQSTNQKGCIGRYIQRHYRPIKTAFLKKKFKKPTMAGKKENKYKRKQELKGQTEVLTYL